MSVSKSLLTPLVTGVQEQCEFMLTLKDIMNNDDDMAKALDKSYVTICNLIHESPIVLASEALEVVKCLQTSPFAKPMRSELAKQIQDKVGAKKVNQSTKARQGSQLCLHWENYVSEARWQTILSDADWNKKVEVVGEVCDDMGLSNSTEKTKTHITSVLHVAMNQGETLTIKGTDFYAKRAQISTHLENLFKCKQPHHGLVTQLNKSTS